jgi:hypothetical protein
MSDGGWMTLSPKPEPQRATVELWGGPLDGSRVTVADVDLPYIALEQAYEVDGEPGVVVGTFRIEYRRRVVDPDEPEPMPLRFDFQRVELV